MYIVSSPEAGIHAFPQIRMVFTMIPPSLSPTPYRLRLKESYRFFTPQRLAAQKKKRGRLQTGVKR